MRLHLGAGFTHVSGTDSFGEKLTVSGGGGSFGLALGGAIRRNLVIFGNLFLSAPGTTDLKVNGVSSAPTDTSAAVFGIGPGIAYYVEPVNLYLSGTVAAMEFEIDDSNGHTLYQSKTGIGMQAMVGKEWWVSESWGVGIAGELVASSMKDNQDSKLTWGAVAFSIAFSATYN